MKIKNKKQKMDQFLTLKRANLGPVFNFTAYIYIYIYIDFFDLLFGIEIVFDLQFRGCRGPKEHARVDPRKKEISMPNNRMQNLDAPKNRCATEHANAKIARP